MNNLILVIVCLLVGLGLQRVKRFPADAAVALNAYVIYLALPALILLEIPKLAMDSRALLPVLAAWIIMVFTALLVFMVARYRHWSRGVTGALMLTVPLGNTSFVGFPLIDALLGPEAMPYAILYDQFGTFIALNTFGIALASFYSASDEEKPPIWKNIVSFPPFIALFIAFVVRSLNYPDWLSDVLTRLASTLVPVVMVAVGLQWRLRLAPEYVQPLAFGIVCCLLVSPLLAWFLLTLLGINGLVANVIVLEAAMPSMISAGVLALSHNLAPKLTAAMVGYSIALGICSVWLWSLILN